MVLGRPLATVLSLLEVLERAELPRARLATASMHAVLGVPMNWILVYPLSLSQVHPQKPVSCSVRGMPGQGPVAVMVSLQ